MRPAWFFCNSEPVGCGEGYAPTIPTQFANESRRRTLASPFRVGWRMSIFEPVQVALAEGYWRVKVNVSSEAAEYISHDRALSLAEELEAEGWRECAAQIRRAAETARRFQAYARP